jgi:hypothetical protein
MQLLLYLKNKLLIKKYELIIVLEYSLLCFGGQDSLKVIIRDCGFLKVVDLSFSTLRY